MKKIVSLISLLFLLGVITNAQVKENNSDTEPIFVTVEKMPVYPGGELEMRRYIGDNIKYPAEAKNKNIEGTVYLRFIVLKTGEVGEVQLLKGVDPLLDKEAIRVVKSLKKFEPAQQGGKKVKVWFSLPVKFELG